MITGIQDFYYNVKDMKKSVQFYSEILGFKIAHEDNYWTSLQLGGVSVGLHWTEGEDVYQIPRDAHGAHGGGTLTLKSTNAFEDKEILQKKGVKILGTADAPWGKMVVFEDLDGNVLKLMEPKH